MKALKKSFQFLLLLLVAMLTISSWGSPKAFAAGSISARMSSATVSIDPQDPEGSKVLYPGDYVDIKSTTKGYLLLRVIGPQGWIKYIVSESFYNGIYFQGGVTFSDYIDFRTVSYNTYVGSYIIPLNSTNSNVDTYVVRVHIPSTAPSGSYSVYYTMSPPVSGSNEFVAGLGLRAGRHYLYGNAEFLQGEYLLLQMKSGAWVGTKEVSITKLGGAYTDISTPYGYYRVGKVTITISDGTWSLSNDYQKWVEQYKKEV